ncbi:MAG: lipid A export permease/ATP-binding protein MsbA [Burkholderiales bacterium]
MAKLIQRLQRLLPYFKGTAWALPVMVVATALGALTEPVIPALMKPLLDDGFRGGINLWTIPAALMGLFAFRGLTGFVAQYALAALSNQGMLALRGALFDKLQQAPAGFFAQNNASSLANTLVYEVQTGTTLLVNALLSLLKDSLTLLALLGYLLYLNWRLTLIVFVIFPAVVWVMKVLSKRLYRVTQATQSATDLLAYVVEENVLAHRVVRLHGAQAQQAGRFASISGQLRRLGMKSTAAAASMTPLTQLLAAAALSAVICTALWQSNAGGSATGNAITVGGFAAFVTAMLMLIAPIKHLSELSSPITRGLAAVERGLDLIDNTTSESGGSYQPASGRAQGQLALSGVVVRYDSSSSNALDGVDLLVQPGATVALVGASGSGKSTLIGLLPRFLAPTAGQIALDGVALPDWDLAALRQQFGYVSQDVVMFNDSIAANVALGATSIDRDRVAAALQAAHLQSYVEGLPQGIDSVVGHNATQLSGGQRQRLAIARAIYKDAPLLILDEATSALDAESEQTVKAALQVLMAGRTTLIIAHRLSTIEHADQIVVLDAGRVLETGSHAELLQRGGAYARLHQMAGGSGFLPADASS